MGSLSSNSHQHDNYSSQKDELDGKRSQKDELDENGEQQDDHCKQFYLNIIDGSLKSAFEKYPPCPFTEGNSMRRARSVVIVGAGVSGLSAAFELEKEGYNVRYFVKCFFIPGLKSIIYFRRFKLILYIW